MIPVVWRDLTCVSPYWGNDRLQNPVTYARMRFEQNIIAGIKESGYQRQTGRSFRTLIRALRAIEQRQTVLILVSNAHQMYQMYDQLISWIEESCTNRASFNKSHQATTTLRNIMDRNERRAVATIAPIHHNLTRSLPADYDLVLLDNVIVDEVLERQLRGTTMTVLCQTLSDIEMRRMSRKDLSFEITEISDGSAWRPGDLLQLPKSETVGTLASINRAGCIPISLTVLYEGHLLELPWDACDIFHRVSSLS